MNKYKISLLTVNGQFVIGASNGENALSSFMYRAGLSHDSFIEIQIVKQNEDGKYAPKMMALNCRGQAKLYPTIEDMFDIRG